MARVKGTKMVICDGCGVEITWTPVVRKTRVYCCQECARGMPCECGDTDDVDAVDLRMGRWDLLPD